MKNLFEWIISISAGILGLAALVWQIRGAYRDRLKETSVGHTALEKEEEARTTLEMKAKEIDVELKGLQVAVKKAELEIASYTARLERMERFVTDNYEDLRELDKKVEKLRQVQDTKIL